MAQNNRKIKRKIRNAYMVSTISIALVLFMLGAVGYLILNARKASDSIKENVTVSVLLKDGIPDAVRTDMQGKLKERKEVKGIKYISKDAAADDFKAYVGNDFVGFLEVNPLPASYEVTMKAEYSEPDSIRVFDAQVSKWEGVDDVLYQERIIEQVVSNIRKLNLILFFFSGTLLLISLILINNTIRMAIYSRRFIINTMKLVGATKGFILRPFLGKALVQGIYSGLIASVMITAIVWGLNRGLPEAGFITDIRVLGIIFGTVVVAGMLISLLFTYWAVSKYVRLNTSQIQIF